MGAICHKQGNLDQAIYYYQKGLQLKPDYAPVYNNLGLVLQKQNKIDEATQWFEKSLSLDPNYADALRSSCPPFTAYLRLEKISNAVGTA